MRLYLTKNRTRDNACGDLEGSCEKSGVEPARPEEVVMNRLLAAGPFPNTHFVSGRLNPHCFALIGKTLNKLG